MRKIKLLNCLLFSALLLPTAGCGASSNNGGGNGNQSSSDEEEYLTEDKFDKDGNLILSYFAIDLDSLQSQTSDTTKIIDYIQKKFKVSFKYLTGTTSSWETVLNQYIGGGDVPDMFFHTRQEPSYSTWLEEKYLFNYSKYLDDYPNLKNAFNRYSEKEMKALLGGDYYSYPIVMDTQTNKDIINEHAMYYRRDWYENLKAKSYKPSSGRELVDPDDESFNYLNFYDLCEGFTKGDPDNNGKDDTYGYAGTKDGGIYWWYPILSMFEVQVAGWHQDDVGKWMPDCVSNNMKQGIDFIASLYDNGFINSNYATTATQSAMKNDFVNGVAGMMTYNATYPMGKGILDLMNSYTNTTHKLSDIVRGMGVVTGINGKKQMFGYSNNYGYLAINNDVSPNKKKKIMEIMDWMLSEEGQTLLNYGIEGVHYKMNNGIIESLLGNDDKGYPKTLYSESVAPGIYRIKGLVSWSTIIPTFMDHREEQMQLLNAWKSEYLVENPLAYCTVDPSYALTIASLDDETEATFKGIVADISGDKKSKRDTIWNNYVKKYKVSGNSYINAMNESAEKLF